jgi:hypothetical protein
VGGRGQGGRAGGQSGGWVGGRERRCRSSRVLPSNRVSKDAQPSTPSLGETSERRHGTPNCLQRRAACGMRRMAPGTWRAACPITASGFGTGRFPQRPRRSGMGCRTRAPAPRTDAEMSKCRNGEMLKCGDVAMRNEFLVGKHDVPDQKLGIWVGKGSGISLSRSRSREQCGVWSMPIWKDGYRDGPSPQ